jgi:prepilin-type N-terminal cleavage/methylation domain-containing protein
MTTSATGEPRGFTLVEILLALALIGLLSWIFVGGSTALLADQGTSPDEQFWKACGLARKAALTSQHDVLLSYDPKAKGFVLDDDGSKTTIAVKGAADDLAIDFHPPASDGGSLVLVGGTVVDTTPMGAATFYTDGTCTNFRAQIRTKGDAHILAIDPWTCAPMISNAPP